MIRLSRRQLTDASPFRESGVSFDALTANEISQNLSFVAWWRSEGARG